MHVVRILSAALLLVPCLTAAQSVLPAAAFPLGAPGIELRESCTLMAGLYLHRIRRGPVASPPAALPCAPVMQTRAAGGAGSQQPGLTSPVGPQVIHILEIDPARFPGKLDSALAQDQISGKETTSSIATRHGALAAVNGGFFVVGQPGAPVTAEGLTGEPAGIAMQNGVLLSEAVAGRASLMLSGARGLQLGFPQVSGGSDLVTAHGRLALDGLNRVPGLVRNCGGHGDQPTDQPRHDVTCTDDDEIVWFDPVVGDQTPSGAGREWLLGAGGQVIGERPAGGPVPAGGAVIAATGDRTADLRRLLQRGGTVHREDRLLADRQILVPEPSMDLINGGPRLLVNGHAELTAHQGGFHHPEDPGFGLIWVDGPNPRTLAGRGPGDRIWLVVVDGRQPEWSAGLPLRDAVALMQHLGAEDAVNLDGGGSSTLVIGGRVLNRPSDGWPANSERPVGDALLIFESDRPR